MKSMKHLDTNLNAYSWVSCVALRPFPSFSIFHCEHFWGAQYCGQNIVWFPSCDLGVIFWFWPICRGTTGLVLIEQVLCRYIESRLRMFASLATCLSIVLGFVHPLRIVYWPTVVDYDCWFILSILPQRYSRHVLDDHLQYDITMLFKLSMGVFNTYTSEKWDSYAGVDFWRS